VPSIKGQLPKAYLRIDPDIDRAKADTRWDFVRLLCEANRQPARGQFKTRALFDAVIGRSSARRLLAAGDAVELDSGKVVVPGWDEWQEGDVTVAERQRRIRSRRDNGVSQPLPHRDTTVTSPLLNRIPTPSRVARGQQGSKAARHKEDLHQEEEPAVAIPRDAIALVGSDRPDLRALAARGMTYIRTNELAILDHIADNERAGEWKPITTGQQVVAGWISEAPKGSHLVDYVIGRENDLKAERGISADEIEAEWQAVKEADKSSAPEAIGRIVERVAGSPP
jgi:hypothetical protein